MNKFMNVCFFAGAFALAALFSVGSASAAFPDDFESGVTFIEEPFFPGTQAFVNSFAITATLNASISGPWVILDYDRADIWPLAVGQNGTTNLNCCVANAWAFIRVNGEWFGGTWEFIRNSQINRSLSALRGPDHLRFSPLANYAVQTGDVIGFMVAGITRNGLGFNNVRERSNIVFWEIGRGVVDPSELGFGPTGGDASIIAPLMDLLEEE